jgi:CheY-like chemotaxis protein
MESSMDRRSGINTALKSQKSALLDSHSHPELKGITKVILLTARGQRTDIERGQAVGCDAYLVKPFSPLELLDTVDRLVAPE